MSEEEVAVSIVAMVILAGAGLLYAAMVNRRKMREMEHRERLAMIERGIAPPTDRPWKEPNALSGTAAAGANRFRSAGIVLVGIGVGLFFVIGFAAGQPQVALGVGGAWAVLGVALLFNYHLLVQRGRNLPESPGWTSPPASTSGPAEPPDNIAP